MHFFVPRGLPHGDGETTQPRRGAVVIMGLFALTIATAVSFHNFLNLPPMLGMMTGLAYLQLYGYYLKITHPRKIKNGLGEGVVGDVLPAAGHRPFDIFRRLAQAEWDTLLFFYGVVLCVGGSLLSIGSAAGVALMGQARGKHTFFIHLKWTPVIALGYAASILVHQWLNAGTYNVPVGTG